MKYLYRELHLCTGGRDFAEVKEVKKFINDIDTFIKTVKIHTPDETEGYIFNFPYYLYSTGEYTNIFELICLDGWEYKNTYYEEDHKVLTFVKIKE